MFGTNQESEKLLL